MGMRSARLNSGPLPAAGWDREQDEQHPGAARGGV